MTEEMKEKAAQSLIDRFRALPIEKRKAILSRLSSEEKAALAYCWPIHARPDQLPPPGDWFTWIIMAGRGAGKALHVDTQIPTFCGWCRMGDLEAGMHVIGSDGLPVEVMVAHDPYEANVYELSFDDGTGIIADADHLWRLDSGEVVTTRDIIVRMDGGSSIHLPVMQPLHGRDDAMQRHAQGAGSRRSVIEAAFFGVWAAAGSRYGMRLGLNLSDAGNAALERFLARYGLCLHGCHVIAGRDLGKRGIDSRILWRRCVTNYGLGTGCPKFIPMDYLRAEEAERWALLEAIVTARGLSIDAITDNGGLSLWIGTEPALLEGIAELARSLGLTAVEHRREAVIITYRQTRQVIDFCGAGRAEVRCITVDAPDRLYCAGRGWTLTHNTRAGAEWVRMLVDSGEYPTVTLVGDDVADVRDIMVLGESGLMTVFPPWQRPEYIANRREVVFWNGARAKLFSAQQPDELRGPQHYAVWMDELAKWRYVDDVFDQVQLGLRLGKRPRQLITTTPRPIPILKRLIARPDTVVTRASTYANLHNLSPAFRQHVLERYEGTRLGRQEIYGEILDDNPHALFKLEDMDAARVDAAPDDLARIVVGVDPAATAGEESAETGIIVAGVKPVDGTDHFYVLGDYTMQGSPQEWAAAAVRAARLHGADAIVAEVNQGGDMVEAVIRNVDSDIRVIKVRATRGKWVRAEPVGALYEQHRVHHVGRLPELEDQLYAYVPGQEAGRGQSPDRMDALVWAITELMSRRTVDVDIDIV